MLEARRLADGSRPPPAAMRPVPNPAGAVSRLPDLLPESKRVYKDRTEETRIDLHEIPQEVLDAIRDQVLESERQAPPPQPMAKRKRTVQNDEDDDDLPPKKDEELTTTTKDVVDDDDDEAERFEGEPPDDFGYGAMDEVELRKKLAELEDLRRRVVELIEAEEAAKAAYAKYNPQNMPKRFFVMDGDDDDDDGPPAPPADGASAGKQQQDEQAAEKRVNTS
mmetsp:Transcript_20606/g.63708  ORF Transcript_20606/g.63708 Transcript_20606/m.63708 type:complete len:222 (+) Transcript_20606:36-701(+)